MKRILLCSMPILPLLLTACVTKTTVVSKSDEGAQPLNVSQVPKARQQAEAHNDLGRSYLSLGRLDIALEEANITIAADSNFAPGHDLQGLVFLFLGENSKALASLSRANKLAPEDTEILNDYGWALCQNKKEAEALEVFKRAIADPLNKAVTRPLTNMGLCLMRLKRVDEAEKYFSQAIQADPNNGQPLFMLAQINYDKGNYPLAKNYLDRLWRVDEERPESLGLGIELARKMKNRMEEGKLSSRLKMKFPDSPEGKRLITGKVN